MKDGTAPPYGGGDEGDLGLWTSRLMFGWMVGMPEHRSYDEWLKAKQLTADQQQNGTAQPSPGGDNAVENGATCPRCAALAPWDGRYCVECGTRLVLPVPLAYSHTTWGNTMNASPGLRYE